MEADSGSYSKRANNLPILSNQNLDWRKSKCDACWKGSLAKSHTSQPPQFLSAKQNPKKSSACSENCENFRDCKDRLNCANETLGFPNLGVLWSIGVEIGSDLVSEPFFNVVFQMLTRSSEINNSVHFSNSNRDEDTQRYFPRAGPGDTETPRAWRGCLESSRYNQRFTDTKVKVQIRTM
jgi:hypothetical protein